MIPRAPGPDEQARPTPDPARPASEEPPAARGRRPAWPGLLLDLTLPFVAAIGLLFAFHPRLLERVGTAGLGGFGNVGPWDANGTAWFYWWLHEAATRGHPLLTPRALACPPDTCDLAQQFPNRVDAWLAFPFFHAFSLPAAFNLAALAVLVLGAVAGYAALRAVGADRLTALLGGLLFGFNPMSLGEVAAGRPVTALVAPLAFTVATGCAALRARDARIALAWAAAAGVAASLTVQAYIPYAPFLALLGACVAALAAIRPASGVARARPLLVGLVVGLVAVVLTAPYLHELLLVRLEVVDVPSAADVDPFTNPRRPWSPALWRELAEAAVAARAAAPDGVDAASRAVDLRVVAARSFSVPGLWSPPAVPGGFGRIDVAVTIALVVAAVAGRRRALGWLAVAVLFWVLLLGPYATRVVSPNHVELLEVAGHRLRLPLAWLAERVPGFAVHLRPYRLFPFVLLCLLLAGGVGVREIARRHPRVGLVARLAVAAAMLWTLRRTHGEMPRFSDVAWSVPAPIAALADEPGDFVIAEVPVGAGHSTGAYQAVHGKRRTEGPNDAFVDTCRDRARTPPHARASRFLVRLWALGAPGAAGPDAAALAEARAAGIRYVVVHRALYARPDLACRSLDAVEASLAASLGPPVAEDPAVAVYAVPPG